MSDLEQYSHESGEKRIVRTGREKPVTGTLHPREEQEDPRGIISAPGVTSKSLRHQDQDPDDQS